MPIEEWEKHIARIDQSLETLNREHSETTQELVKLRESLMDIKLGFATFKAEFSSRLNAQEELAESNRKLLWAVILEGFFNLMGLIGLVIALMKFLKP